MGTKSVEKVQSEYLRFSLYRSLGIGGFLLGSAVLAWRSSSVVSLCLGEFMSG